MTTPSSDIRPELQRDVRALLVSLRRRIRLYVWVDGLASAAAWLGVAFWASLAIDWFFEPPIEVRRLVMLIAVVVLGGVLFRLIGRRAFVPLSDASMATLLERRYRHLDDSLLTAVILCDRPLDAAQCNPEMLDHTCRLAAGRIGDLRLSHVFDPGPLRRSIMAAVLLATAVGLFAHTEAVSFDVWARRNLLFSNRPWPRKTRLEVEGFVNQVAKVARGADFEVIVRADTAKELVPEAVEVRYRIEGGARGRATMNRLGTARKGADPFQEYSFTFQGVLAPIRFDVAGGDDRVAGLRIEVVESPTIHEILLDCEFPAYMGRTPRTLPFTGVFMPIPQGTRVTVRARANKDLARVQIDTACGQRTLPPEVLGAKDLAGDPRTFRHTIASLDEDATLVFTLSDTDGITGRDPVRLRLAVVADVPPQLAVRLEGIGPAITPEARLPAIGQISDDYGVARAWFDYAVDAADPVAMPIDLAGNSADAADSTAGSIDVKLDAALPVGDLKLTPGQKLVVSVKAADRCDLNGRPDKGPNVGASDRWLLDIVTADQLRAMLEARELVLRQRFERIIEEVTETRDQLLAIEFGAAATGREEVRSDTNAGSANADGTNSGDAASRDPIGAGGEPGDRPAAGAAAEPLPERQTSLQTLRVQRSLQNGRKNAQETEGVAEAFDDIRMQLINNAIDTEELMTRLKDHIADPLHRTVDEMFPELDRRLELLEQHLGDQQLGPQQRDLARQQADAILLEMHKALDRMIELEDYKEAVELLRSIIKLQEDLDNQTQQRHKAKLRELLEDAE